MRISETKYKQEGKCDTVAESFEKLIEECMIPYREMYHWQEFRDYKLWKVEVNDVFHANEDGIKSLMSHYITATERSFTKENAI